MKVKQQLLYLPEFEHCGAGFICNLNGIKSNDIIHKALDILIKLDVVGEALMEEPDGTGFFDIPHDFFKKYVILLFKTTVCSGNGFHQKPS
jgi:glutamate synthase (ferredoxin)